jgi:hypothetical protein
MERRDIARAILTTTPWASRDIFLYFSEGNQNVPSDLSIVCFYTVVVLDEETGDLKMIVKNIFAPKIAPRSCYVVSVKPKKDGGMDLTLVLVHSR